MANLIYLAKGVFFVTLTTLHFFFFGLPALERYLEHGVSVNRILKDTKSLSPPAVPVLEKERMQILLSLLLSLCFLRHQYHIDKKSSINTS